MTEEPDGSSIGGVLSCCNPGRLAPCIEPHAPSAAPNCRTGDLRAGAATRTPLALEGPGKA
ncbi:hypothetical protein Ct61P_00990 [Colletotrichum tofieldiae]|nr:hypothetical protein Ct61P_00990 [Colletotrichum tofieldiae]